MDRTAMLEAIKALSVEDRQWLVQEICETIPEEDAPPLTDVQKADLDDRLAEWDAEPDDVLTWEDAKASVRRNKT